MIRLTRKHDGGRTWVNPAHIVRVFEVGEWGGVDQGNTRIITSDMRGDEYFDAVESVDAVIEEIYHDERRGRDDD